MAEDSGTKGSPQGIEVHIGQTTDLVSVLWENLQCSTSPF